MKCDLCGKYLSERDLAEDASLCSDCHGNVFEKNVSQKSRTEEPTESITTENKRTLSNSLFLLEIYIIIAIVAARSLPINRSDWFGIGFIINTIIFIIIAIFLWKITPLNLNVKSESDHISNTDEETTHIVTEQNESDYINDLNKTMEKAGVDNLCDLELYQERNKSKS